MLTERAEKRDGHQKTPCLLRERSDALARHMTAATRLAWGVAARYRFERKQGVDSECRHGEARCRYASKKLFGSQGFSLASRQAHRYQPVGEDRRVTTRE
jgi:hypothetical protein